MVFIAYPFRLKLGLKPVRTMLYCRVGWASCSCLNFDEFWCLMWYGAKLTSVAKCLFVYAEGCVVEFTSHMQDIYKTVSITFSGTAYSCRCCPGHI